MAERLSNPVKGTEMVGNAVAASKQLGILDALVDLDHAPIGLPVIARMIEDTVLGAHCYAHGLRDMGWVVDGQRPNGTRTLAITEAGDQALAAFRAEVAAWEGQRAADRAAVAALPDVDLF
jgi:hypothetical protein